MEGDAALELPFRERAATLEVPKDYKGPVYRGPDSVDAKFVRDLLDMYKAEGNLPLKCVYDLTLDVLQLLRKEKSLQRISIPKESQFTVVGDLHGQFYDFAYMLEEVTGMPSPENPILFNGDFVDRGDWSLEVLMVLFAFKLQNPTAVHFNRGNHESEMTNYQYGFAGEVEAKYEAGLMELFSETFRHLPLAHVLEDQVFVVHAGLPGPEERLWEDWFPKAPDEARKILKREKQVSLDDIESVNRVVEPNPMDDPLVIDMLWADPKGSPGYGPSSRVPQVYTFGPDIVKNFVEANGLKYVIRSHETKTQGYQEGEHMCTVFSAPNYIDRVGNKAAVVVLTNRDGLLERKFKQFEHQPHPDVPSGAYAPGGILAP